MKKIRKSTGVALAFLIYVSVTAAYLLPRNTEVSLTEKNNYGGSFLCHRPPSLAGASEKGTNARTPQKRRTIYSLKKVSL